MQVRKTSLPGLINFWKLLCIEFSQDINDYLIEKST